MSDTLTIRTVADEVVKVITEGPQGVAGDEAAVLTTEGDMLYQGASAAARLPIGSEGQVLKVSSGIPAWGTDAGGVTSVAVASADLTITGSPITTSGTITANFTAATTASLALADSAVQPGDLATVATSGSYADLANIPSTFTPASHTHATAVADPAGSDGFLSSGDKQKLDGIATSANNYTHPNHTGDVTSSGDGATTIANSAVTYAKIQNVTATDKLLGRSTAGAGVVEEIACTSAGRALIDDADASAQRTTLGLGNSAVLDTGTGAGTVATGDHTHAQLHDRSHAITSASDHTAGTHKVFYSDGSGNVTELPLGASGEVLTSNGAAAAPSFAAASGGIGGGTGSTDNAILRADGTGGSTAQAADIVIDDATTSTQANVAIVNAHSETNSALVLTPKGTGALIAGPKPDGVASGGGNARGANAVDFQQLRSAATQVASGLRSVIAGGQRNTSSGLEGAIGGGHQNSNVAPWGVIAGGYQNSNTSALGQSAICGGMINTASHRYTFIGGGARNVASNMGTVVGGGGDNAQSTNNNIASATLGAILGGLKGLADRYALQAHAAGNFSGNVSNTSGEAQRIRAVLRCKTTTDSAVEMALNGSTTYLTIPSGKVIFCNIKVVGVKSDGSAVATYERQYAAKNVAGTSSEVYAAVTIGTDNAASTSLAVSVDVSGDFISIKPTGIASETWRWVASVDAVEVAYGS